MCILDNIGVIVDVLRLRLMVQRGVDTILLGYIGR